MPGHPSCCRLSKEELVGIKEMTRSGISPCQILSSLRQSNPKLQAVSRTIYNARVKLRNENLGGRSTIQALFEELQEGDFTFHVAHDHDGHLTRLFFAHPSSIALTRSYSNTFVMDCTYKTKKYKIPLLEIIGVSSFNTSFYSCFTFLSKEGEEDYTWALQMFSKILDPSCHPNVILSDRELSLMNAIKVVFPTTKNLLCVWHIEKNVLANCKSYFEGEEDWTAFLSSWTEVINSPNEVAFEESWKLFVLLYKDKENALLYLQRTWLPFKEYFVKAWTEKVAHFGNMVTSRAGGAHSKFKRYLQVSTGDLLKVKNDIILAVENEFNEIKAQVSSERIRVPLKCRVSFFKELVTRVSIFAMEELYKQYEMVTCGTVPTMGTGHFTSTMGLPCAHKIMEWKRKELPLDAIHSQWRIDTRVAAFCNDGHVGDKGEFEILTQELENKYEEWPLLRKEKPKELISQLLNPSLPLVLEPNVHSHKGRPLGSRKDRASSSTKRNPSHFEIVESSRKCGVCHSTRHNSRTCPKKSKTKKFT